jgi:putative salt-induced outer membrane protein YdiY
VTPPDTVTRKPGRWRRSGRIPGRHGFVVGTAAYVLRMGLQFASLALAVGSVTSIRGATLVLSNGDHVTGHTVKRADGKIYFHSDILGALVVPEESAHVVDAPGGPAQTPAPPPAHVAPPPEVQVAESRRPPWKGQVEFGYENQESTYRTVNLTLHASLERSVGPNHLLVKGSYLYGISAGQPNVERHDASVRWRHTLSRRTFVQSLTSYGVDKVRLLNHRIEQNLGIGFKVYGSARQTVNVGAGVSGLYLDAAGTEPGFGYLGNVFQDYTFRINGQYTLVQDASVQYSPETPGGSVYVAGSKTFLYRSTQDHVVGLHSTLRQRITDRLSLNLRLGYEYDSAIPNPAARGDERITTTLGVNF